MKKLLAGTLAMISLSTLGHTQSPGSVENLNVYKEVNTFEFTLANRNKYKASYSVFVGDFDPETQNMVEGTEKRVGTIKGLEYNESVKFSVHMRVAPATLRVGLMCTELDMPNVPYRSRVCSKITMKRR